MPLVSVVIPTYRHREFVLETLNSVWAQTFKDYEVIVVNDGSPDDTAEVLRPLREAGRIRYLEQPNAGQAAARNRGLAEARGEFIAFLDDDDLWPPEKLQWQVAGLRQAPELGCLGGTCLKFEVAPPVPVPQGQGRMSIDYESLFDGSPFISPGQVLIRKCSLQVVGGFDENVWGADDLDLYMRLSRISGMVRQDRVALYYRLHPGNASKQLERMLLNCKKVVHKHLAELPKQRQATARRTAYRWLFRYLGRQFIARGKGRLRAGSSAAGLRDLLTLRALAPQVASDPWLAKAVLRELLPVRFRSSNPSLTKVASAP